MQDFLIDFLGFFIFVFSISYAFYSVNKRFKKLEQEIDTLKRKLKKYE